MWTRRVSLPLAETGGFVDEDDHQGGLRLGLLRPLAGLTKRAKCLGMEEP